MKNQIFAVIMAGGSGVRFWPKSRKKLPKQFLRIKGDKTMIQSTVKRIESLVPYQNTIVVTNFLHANTVQSQLPSIPSENIVLEPVARNTAPCIGLAALIVEQKDSDAVMLVLPADHWTNDDRQFCNELKIAAAIAAEKETLIAFGIKPSYPETGYGYIQCGKKKILMPESGYEIYQIENFREKPDIKQAKEFVESGNFYWNSGTFVWKASAILEEIEKYLPSLHQGLMKVKKILETNKEVTAQSCEEKLPNGVVKEKSFPKHIEQLQKNEEEIDKIFSTFQSKSIDFGIMEKTNRAEVIISQVDWSDIGNWKALENHLPADNSGNVASKKHILIDTNNSIIEGNERMIAAIGLKDMLVIDTEDVLLICPKERYQEIKNLVEQLKKEGKDEFL